MPGKLLTILGLIAALVSGPARAAEEPPEGAEALAATARAALDAWKYEEAREALDRLAQAAPGEPRLSALKLEFLARVGRFEEAAALAKSADPGLAEKLPFDAALRIGRALAAAGGPAQGRKWVLAALRRAGPGAADRAADTLAALIAPQHGGAGLVTPAFAAELAGSDAERAEAAKAYQEISAALAAEKLPGPAGELLRAAEYAALRRLAEFSDGITSAAPPLGKSRLLWQVPVGVDEQPELFAVSDGLVLTAGHVNGRALPGMPLPAKLRAFDLLTGAQKWSLDLAPVTDAPGGPDRPGTAVSFNARASALAAGGGRAYVLVKTERFERRGASRAGSTTAATLTALDLRTGRPAWRVEAPRMAERLYLAGAALVATGFRSLAGYAVADGRQLWTREPERALSGEGAVAAGGLVLPGWREITCLDPAANAARWTAARNPGTAVLKRCLSDGALVALAESGGGLDALAVLDGATGKQLWARGFTTPRSEKGELELVLAGPHLVAARGAVLRGVTAKDGADAWRAVLPVPGGDSAVRLAAAGPDALWSGGGQLAALDGRSGKPVWWSPGPQAEARPLDCAGAGGPALVASGLAPRLLSAWRLGADDGKSAAARAEAAGRLLAAAERLAAAGRRRAATRLLEIARTYATPGVLAAEWAAFREEAAAGGAAGAFAERGLFAAALAAALGGAEKDAAVKFARSALERAAADDDEKCLAAAALLLLGDGAGARHLAARGPAWADKADRLQAVLTACRAAGPAAVPVLLAGLGSGAGASRALLAEQLAGHKGAEVQAALEKLLADPDRNARLAAAASLAAVAGEGAVAGLQAALKREEDFVVKDRLRELLTALGHRPEPPVVRPPRDPDPGPTPPPPPPPQVLTREQAAEKLAREGKVLWSKPDAAAPTLTWIAVEKKFVFLHNAGDGALTGYADFIKLVGRAEVSAAELAFGTDSVWAATDRGAFCYDRRTRAWSQLVINLDMDLVEASVEKVGLTEGAVAFTVKGKGRFEQDLKTKKWRKL